MTSSLKPSSNEKDILTVRPLRPDDWRHIRHLFGKNGACGGCWCMWWRVPRGGRLWEECKGAKNQRSFKRLVTSGKVHGCLAFAGDEPVGWCCTGPRADFPRLERVKGLQTDWGEHTWSVTCFFIRAGWRGSGVATALLAEAVKLARDQGAKTLEAYPVRSEKAGQKVPAAFAWTGLPSLFQKGGFDDVTPPGNTRPIYQLTFRRCRNR